MTGPVAASPPAPPIPRLGRGRSAVVYLDLSERDRPLARKVFTGDRASRAVLYVLTGAGNPYGWSEAAVRCAVARRRILEHLVPLWLGPRLRVGGTDGWSWDEHARAHVLRSEFIDGRHLPLHGPFTDRDAGAVDPLHDLKRHVMAPLQRHLRRAGFDGLLWQAGLGNPVAGGNFMQEDVSRDGARACWVWVDLESGVPALFALNPLATLGFYLPKSIRHRRWLFDDVNVAKLRRYVTARSGDIDQACGPRAREEIARQVDELDAQQRAWRALRRHQRGIADARARGRLTDEQVEFYARRPLRWHLRLLGGAVAAGARAAGHLARRAAALLHWRHVRHIAHRAWLFTVSQRFRWHIARRYVSRAIRGWTDRRFLTREEAGHLRRQLRREETGAYLTDFIVHLALKPLVKPLQWWVVPALWVAGFVNELTLAIALVLGGAIARSAYTVGRLLQAAARRQRRPWVALGVGVLPVVGNAAYPAQLLYCSADDSAGLARFILSDTFARMGRAVPVWGGVDSLLEHRFNRLGDVMMRWLSPRGGAAAIEVVAEQ